MSTLTVVVAGNSSNSIGAVALEEGICVSVAAVVCVLRARVSIAGKDFVVAVISRESRGA